MQKNRYNLKNGIKIILATIAVALASCQNELPSDIAKAGPLAVTTTDSVLVLQQKNSLTTNAVTFSWTTGTNNGTGASMSYQLQLDIKGNNFAKAINLDMGKGTYSRSFSSQELNDSLLSHWKLTPGVVNELEVRVISTIYSTPQTNVTSPVVTLKVTAYQPVSQTLFLYGTASPRGTDLNNPLGLIPQTDPTIFVYQGMLNAGTLKFITTTGQVLPSYNMDADTTKIVYRTDIGQTDNLFTIVTAGVYRIQVSLLDLTVSISKINYPAYGNVYIEGTAVPNGTTYTTALQMTQSASNPFVFTYRGVLNVGSFKFPVNNNADGNQDMFMRVDDTHFYIHQGGTTGDDEWTIAKKGYYTITLNQQDNSLTIYREQLYMVGSATPIGWTITSAVQMTEDATNGCIFTWTGPMVIGEFKFPVNRNSDWGQDMYMRVDDTHMYRHVGGQPDDNKWNITVAGNYEITANIENNTLSFVKQ